ncbi:PLDc N-terminal domain-containing protein [Arthrobacter sp. Y-9]|uniref:PLDc N-terminal domain-containing protein n=1 Tax=Arthrobacter sp. Y-9 TaxID=3039385 RepID=UPI00241D3F1C|nr:PLDc N-terminal domain-containing protein [Arthrobacter sp. Y-9]WFR83586.1 PLDc N-terminal domain-containing protein [Arthrobacter sp. Y-9]
MPRVIISVVIVAVCIYALIDCLRTDSREVRGVPKGVWIVALLLLPLLGALLWFLLGRPRSAATRPATGGPATNGRAAGGTASGRPLGPDDDPQFLRNLEERRRNQEEARKLEEMRKKLEEQERRLHKGDDGAPSQDA